MGIGPGSQGRPPGLPSDPTLPQRGLEESLTNSGGCPKNADRWWLKWFKMAILPMKKTFLFFSWIDVDGGLPVSLGSVQDVGARHVRYYCIIIYIYICIHIHIYIYTFIFCTMACCGTWHTYIRTIAKQDGSVVGPLPISGALTAVVGDLAALLGSLGSTLRVENRGVEWITHMLHVWNIYQHFP